MTFKIAQGLSLPASFVTSRQAVVAKARVGKSYVSQVIAEEMLEQSYRVVVIDPTGAWWGLRSSADGRQPGYPITIFGGDHGDVPLELGAGSIIADAVVDELFSCVLDLSLFDDVDWSTFIADFLSTLYRRNRYPIHVFIDEADVACPQNPQDQAQQRALRATNNIVRRGGIKGIGCTLISQRAALLNKNVLAQIEQLVVLQTHQKHDLKAVREWVSAHDVDDQAEDMLASLPSLPIGEAWVWAPSVDLFKRVKVRRKRTFDSGKTPDAGEHVVEPKALAQVDVKKLGTAIAATAARAAANDPKALKARVAELERELARKQPIEVERVVEKRVEVPVTPPDVVTLLEAFIANGRAAEHAIASLGAGATPAPKNGHDATRAHVPRATGKRQANEAVAAARNARIIEPAAIDVEASEPGTPTDVLSGVLTLSSLGIPVSVQSLAAWVGVHPKNKTLLKLIGELRATGMLDGLTLTNDGAALARVHDPTKGELRTILAAGLSEQQRDILAVLATFARDRVSSTLHRLALWLGLHPKNKTLLEDVGKLRERGFVTGYELTELGKRATVDLSPRTNTELIEQFSNGQRDILSMAIIKSPPSISALADALGLHPKNKTLLEDIGKLRDRGLLAKGWPLRATEVFA